MGNRHYHACYHDVSSFHEPLGAPMPIHCGTPQKRFQAPTKKEKSEKNSRQTAGPLKSDEGGGARSSKADMECEYWGMLHSGSNFLASLMLGVSLDSAQGKAKCARRSVLVFCGKVCWCLTGMRESEHHQRPVEVQAFKGGAGGEAPRAPA